MSSRIAMRPPSIPTGYVFPLLIASAVAAWRLPEAAVMAVALELQHWESDAYTVTIYAVRLAVVLLPFLVAAACWCVLSRGMRTGVLGVLAVLAAPTAHAAAGVLDGMAGSVAEFRRVAAELAPMRAAMRALPPEEAARRAVAAGNREFLAISGFVVIVPGVANVCAADARGWMLIRNTSDGFRSRGHLGFQSEAWHYARRYNDEVIALLRLDRAELERDIVYCSGDPANQDARRRYWPDGGPVE